MKIKKENGIAGVDMIIAILALTIFSALIISLIYNNVIENVKLKHEALAMIYITEIFENIGIANYEQVTEENINTLVPEKIRNSFKVTMNVTTDLEDVVNNEGIMKKIEVELSYDIANKTYSYSMQRMKIKE